MYTTSGDDVKTLLSGSVPYLKLYVLAVNLEVGDTQVHAVQRRGTRGAGVLQH